jgi:uncharacterized membrane protein YfcA
MDSINPLYSIAGVAVGLLVGFTGVGGGSLMTPLLVLAFGFHPSTAVGTDLLYASATKSVGAAVHGRSGTVDWRVVRRLAAGSVPATIATLLVLSVARTRFDGVEHIIATVLGVTLMLTSVAMLFRNRIRARYGAVFEAMPEHRIARLTVALGAILGVLVSVSSVGAGAIGMTALLVLYPHMPTSRLVGSDIAHAVPITLVAGLGHMAMNAVDFSLLLSLLVGSVPGIIIGSLFATRVPDGVLRVGLAITLAVVGFRLIL